MLSPHLSFPVHYELDEHFTLPDLAENEFKEVFRPFGVKLVENWDAAQLSVVRQLPASKVS